MNKTITAILFFILVLVSFAVAQPPFEAPQLGGVVDIEFPKFDYIELNSAYVFHVHAHNATDGLLLTNDTTSCILHLYNQSDHIIEEYMIFNENGYDFEYDLDHALNKTGVYSYLVYCNTTYQGGYVSAAFDVTKDGKPDEFHDSTSGLGIALFLLLINIGIFALPWIMQFKSRVKQWIMTQIFFILGLTIMAFNSTIFATIAYNSNLGITSEIFTFQWLFLRAVFIFVIFLFFNMFIAVPKLLKENKERQRMGKNEE